MLNIEKLTADVEAQTTVVATVVQFIVTLNAEVGDLSAQLAAAIASNDPAELAKVQAAVDDLDTKLAANTVTLATAAQKNIPAPATPASS